jgi:AcrR family transcriptional regulator
VSVPKIWNETIESHRNAVREAVMDTTAALAAEHGMSAVTMSQIAQQTGIGRATLYKYFSDVEAILTAWHEHQINNHLHQLADIAGQVGNPGHRLEAVLRDYAHIARERHDTELAALLHRGEHVAMARQHLRGFLAGLLREAAEAGDVRTDIPPEEMADYCLHALTAAGTTRSKAAIDRLVQLTLTGLQPTCGCPEFDYRV